jgi:hypothetical protein
MSRRLFSHVYYHPFISSDVLKTATTDIASLKTGTAEYDKDRDVMP